MPWNVPGGSGDKNPWGQGGGRGNQGPPDLDEIVRKIQAKLGALFGGGRGSGGGGGVSRGFSGGIGLIAILLVAVWLASGFYVVQQGSRGVVLRFGQLAAITGAGLHWHLPYPIARVEKVNVQERSVIEIGYRSNGAGGKTKVSREALMLTQDENIVDIEFAVQYRIEDPAKYLFNVKDVRDTIQEATESAIREEAGKNTMDFILTSGRDAIGDSTRVILQEILNRYDCGILITNLEMQEAQPPEQVKAAFDDAVKAREDEARLKNEAEADANDIVPRARGAAARTVQEAQGYKASVVARAQGDARRFSLIAREYAKAPHVTRERMYLQTMQEVLENTTKVLVDQKGGNNLIYLPLDKILAHAADKAGKTLGKTDSSSEPKPQPSIRDRMDDRVPIQRIGE